MTEANIAYRDDSYSMNLPFLIKVNDVYKGNRIIKSKGEIYLSKKTKENENKFKERLKLSVFYPHFRKSIDNLENMLFRKGVSFSCNKKYEQIFENLDGEGSKLHTVMRTAANKALIDGMSFLWIDAPSFEGQLTLLEQKNLGYLPFLKVLSRLEVINKKVVIEKGRAKLTKVVIEQKLESEGDGFKPVFDVVQIVLEVNKGTVYKKVKNKFEIISEWTNNLGYIPIVPIYSKKEGYLEADIPFLDLADMNLKHYNAQSSLDHTLEMVANPQPIMFNYENDNGTNNEIVIGVNNALLFEDKQTGGAEYLEIEGKGIAHIEKMIESIEFKMDKMSLSVIYTDTFKTATEARFNEEKNNLFLVEISNSLEDGFNVAFRIISDFLGEDIEAQVSLSKEFVNKKIDAVMVDELLKLRKEGYISTERLWDVLIKGEILEAFDYEVEKEKILRDSNEVLNLE